MSEWWRRRESKPFEASGRSLARLDQGRKDSAVTTVDKRRFSRIPVVNAGKRLEFAGCVAETTGLLTRLVGWLSADGRRCTCEQCMSLMARFVVAWSQGCSCDDCRKGRVAAAVSRRLHNQARPELLTVDCQLA